MKKMLEKIDYSNPDNKHKMNMLFIELMDSAKEYDKEMYDYAKMELYEVVYGKVISEECADEWVKSMQPMGKHWSMDDTTSVMQDLGYNCDKIDYFVVSNMMFNDYHDLVKDDETLALKMAYDWLNDVDAVDGKLYDYWKYIAKRD